MATDKIELKCEIEGLQEAIVNYAIAYEKLEEIQRDQKEVKENESEIPIGDQKIGVIGEYIGIQILKKIYAISKSKVNLCINHSQKGFDAIIETNGEKKYIQIKTVSDYSMKGYTSIFKQSFKLKNEDEEKDINGLLIIRLDKTLKKGSYVYWDKVEQYKGYFNKGISTKKIFETEEHVMFELK